MSGLPDNCSASPVDEDIYCPFCHYNLTGILTGVCPECGSMFDREILLQATREEAHNVIPWDSPESMPFLRRYWETLKLTWFHPKEFGLAFGFVRRETRAGRFLALSAGLFTFTAALSAGADAWFRAAWFRAAWYGNPRPVREFAVQVLGDWFCSILILLIYVSFISCCASLALGVLVRHRDGQRHFWPWWTILRFAAGHFLLAFPFPIVCAGFAYFLDLPMSLTMSVVGPLVLLGCVILWGFTLEQVVKSRTRGKGGAVVFQITLGAIIALVPATMLLILGLST